MHHPIASPAAHVPAAGQRDAAGNPGRDRRPEPSRLWALLEALAYAGAYVDPSGVLAIQRLRQAKEEQEAEERDERN